MKVSVMGMPRSGTLGIQACLSEVHLEWESLNSMQSIRKYLNHRDPFSNRKTDYGCSDPWSSVGKPEHSKAGQSESMHAGTSSACSDEGW